MTKQHQQFHQYSLYEINLANLTLFPLL